MLPWIQLDRATIPGEGGELRLKQRGAEFSILLGSTELMNSRLSGSEEALATLSCERIAGRKNARMLIGGLGMGFTLRAALGALPEDTRVTVAELVPAVVDWARGPMAEFHKGTLDDPRVDIHVGDVGALIRSRNGAYDAILLDVDNGPDGLTRASNDSLYNHAGLRAAKAALRENGVLAVWSSAPDAAFTRRLRDAGFAAEEIFVRANGKRGGRHVLWMATNR
ncbi:Spermidine synthase (plasmid) [Neorhizobium galegae bv. officinalis bv. officinalis str. HAMBI 1141]|uniref:Spermidine synthase n=1 Tax=Neorhizobium galegae bv. officinalis bv. officinalis str. HAMBI 1141 TaxID=1028801 RepID=A0A068THP2_NEOGA|nr:MnmC family methyltransferase [Neorhizobium galegae]CDN57020.1 Spermidine synthase [Neorhizobium galegae bv. officinalis bv. officinalis str. HAMBI 1141]